MAVVLYKDGEAVRVSPRSVPGYLAQVGLVLTLEGHRYACPGRIPNGVAVPGEQAVAEGHGGNVAIVDHVHAQAVLHGRADHLHAVELLEQLRRDGAAQHLDRILIKEQVGLATPFGIRPALA